MNDARSDGVSFDSSHKNNNTVRQKTERLLWTGDVELCHYIIARVPSGWPGDINMAGGFTWLNAGRRKPRSKRGCSRGQGFPEGRGNLEGDGVSVSVAAVVQRERERERRSSGAVRCAR